MICRLRLFYISELHHPSKTFIMIPDDACTAIRKVRKENSIVLFKKESKDQIFQSLVKNAFQQINQECTGPFLRKSSNS